MLTSEVELLSCVKTVATTEVAFADPILLGRQLNRLCGFELVLRVKLLDGYTVVGHSEPIAVQLDVEGDVPEISIDIQEWANQNHAALLASYNAQKGRKSRAENPAPTAPAQTAGADRSLGSSLGGATQI